MCVTYTPVHFTINRPHCRAYWKSFFIHFVNGSKQLHNTKFPGRVKILHSTIWGEMKGKSVVWEIIKFFEIVLRKGTHCIPFHRLKFREFPSNHWEFPNIRSKTRERADSFKKMPQREKSLTKIFVYKLRTFLRLRIFFPY